MFRLEKLVFLTSKFIYLNYDVPLCASCMFGTSSRRQCITKGNKSGSIKKETDNNPGAVVSVDQLQSAHKISFPKL